MGVKSTSVKRTKWCIIIVIGSAIWIVIPICRRNLVVKTALWTVELLGSTNTRKVAKLMSAMVGVSDMELGTVMADILPMMRVAHVAVVRLQRQ